jgi:hypothetical protein
MNASLVEFVEDHESGRLQRRIALQHAGQDSFGDHLDPGARPYDAVPADAVADGLAHRFALKLGHPPGRGARRQATRLQQQNPAAFEPRLAQQRQRHHRGLARAGGRLQDRTSRRGKTRDSSGSTGSIGRPNDRTAQA